MNKVYKPIDPGTFGGTKAAIYLADILNEKADVKVLRHVSSIIHFVTARLKSIEGVEYHEYFAKLIRKDAKETLYSYKLDPLIEHLTFNIISTYYKISLRNNKRAKYRLKVNLNNKLTKNKIFSPPFPNGSIRCEQGDSFININFNDENYFEKV